MNTRDISAFIAVVDTGSIVQAAAALHLTQPGVTRRVQSLELLLGVELLDRQSKPLRPTAAGREVYQKGRQLLHAQADLMALVHADVEPSGELRLGMPPFLAEMALTVPVDCLRERFPRLGLRIAAGWSSSLLEQVEQGLLDVAAVVFSECTPSPAGLIAHAFNRQAIKVVASPTLGLRTRVGLKDLAAFPWVLSQNGCGMRSALRRALEAQGLPCDVGVEAFGADLQLSLVARGAGIGLVTPDLLAASVYRDRLKVLSVSDFKIQVVAWLVHRALPPRLEAPVALLLQQLKIVMAKR
ncbi:LysR family transcriptional regulator [Dyella tabacisoli]|uniref:LysR family transcriptional regulator n=1 Tax=Dyella tabacisoli TaxID=2282381 RepID=A0A369UL58_9GAMM|nr:LysR family transcriptional regulator [Dyella tabacisoli]RDD81063.1 LysR family transcriptional regulator [Dyella tabacisoli]